MLNPKMVVPWALLKRGLVFADAGLSEQRLEELRAQCVSLREASEALVAKADEGGNDLSDDDLATIAANRVEVAKLEKQIQARETAKITGVGRKVPSEPTDQSGKVPALTAARSRGADQGKHGFATFGEFAMAVQNHYGRGQIKDDLRMKLTAAATTYGSEGTGADGGFLVPPEFAAQIWKKVMGEENLMTRCAQLQTGGNSMMIPKDENAPWDTSSGIIVYWQGEASAITASKPALAQSLFQLVKLTALVPISDELLEDGVGVESWLRAKAPEKMASKINAAIVNGNGVGQPLGILNSPSLVTVVKQASPSQTTDIVVLDNIVQMWGRMYAPWRRNAIWLINQDVEPSLYSMAFLPGAASPVPVYLPMGGLSGSPYATLLGRPVVATEACSVVGSPGDIILVDLNQYWILTKASGIRTDTSIHLYFDQSLTTFRFIFRMNGMPAWSSAITPQNGSSNTRSWAVVVEDR